MPPKKEFSSFSLVATLGVICACAGLALSAVYEVTKGPIDEAKRREKLQAIEYVLPEHANQPDKEAVALAILTNQATGEVVQVAPAGKADALQPASGQAVAAIEAYPARDKGGALLGWAIPTSNPQGYGGTLKFMVGLDAQGRIARIKALEIPETPGLGDAVAKPKFLEKMQGKGAEGTKWTVSKDGGDIDGITAATISSRAAIGAISSAFPIYEALEAMQ